MRAEWEQSQRLSWGKEVSESGKLQGLSGPQPTEAEQRLLEEASAAGKQAGNKWLEAESGRRKTQSTKAQTNGEKMRVAGRSSRRSHRENGESRSAPNRSRQKQKKREARRKAEEVDNIGKQAEVEAAQRAAEQQAKQHQKTQTTTARRQERNQTAKDKIDKIFESKSHLLFLESFVRQRKRRIRNKAADAEAAAQKPKRTRKRRRRHHTKRSKRRRQRKSHGCALRRSLKRSSAQPRKHATATKRWPSRSGKQKIEPRGATAARATNLARATSHARTGGDSAGSAHRAERADDGPSAEWSQSRSVGSVAASGTWSAKEHDFR